MSIGSIITGNPTVTATGAVTTTTGLDISGITGDYTVHMRVQSYTTASGTPKATLTLEDSVNAFTAAITVLAQQIQGSVDTKSEQHFIWRKYQLSNLRCGTASAVLRANVTVLGGTTPALQLDSWIEY